MPLASGSEATASSKTLMHSKKDGAMELIVRTLQDERGQDVIEYALLASFLGFAAAAAVGLLSTAMNTVYTSWDAAGQNDALVEVPDPK
jgi:Flp pilus assembly pilin Flp